MDLKWKAISLVLFPVLFLMLNRTVGHLIAVGAIVFCWSLTHRTRTHLESVFVFSMYIHNLTKNPNGFHLN